LDAFKKLGYAGDVEFDQKPQMSITSGRVHILIDEDYELKEEYVDDSVLGQGRQRIIAFNKQNDLFVKADSAKVKLLKGYFPGTVICMKFYVDSRYLNSWKGDK